MNDVLLNFSLATLESTSRRDEYRISLWGGVLRAKAERHDAGILRCFLSLVPRACRVFWSIINRAANGGERAEMMKSRAVPADKCFSASMPLSRHRLIISILCALWKRWRRAHTINSISLYTACNAKCDVPNLNLIAAYITQTMTWKQNGLVLCVSKIY